MKHVLPKSNVCVRVKSVLSNRSQPRILKVLKKELLSLINKRMKKKMSCRFNKLNPFRIMTVINRSTSWSYELKNIFPKYRYAFTIRKGRTYHPKTLKYWVGVQRGQP